jgi:hypothetical protein
MMLFLFRLLVQGRSPNNQVLPETAAILEAILAILMNEKRTSPSPQPSPPSGERGNS